MFTVAMFAADRRPTVTVTSARTFEIVIDGRHYMPNYGNTVSISTYLMVATISRFTG
jgi:hypothetical protein